MLILVRHGQTTANAEGRLIGRADTPLTELGRAQAEAVARALATSAHPGVRIVSSPLARALETARAIQRTLGAGADIEVDDRWIELDYGEYDGAPFAAVPASIWDQWRTDAAFAPPGGESLVAVGARVRDACAELAPDAATSDIVVVSHVSPIKAAVGWALGVGDAISWRLHLDVAAISRIATDGAAPRLRSYNEVWALAGVRSAPPPLS